MVGQQIKLIGRVVPDLISAGSKSEHPGLKLETSKGSFVLRRRGGNPFYDQSLQDLAGKVVEAVGTIHNYIFMADEVHETS